MKLLYIFRESYDSQYILSKLNAEKYVGAVILETGRNAKRKKLYRYFKNRSIFSYPMQAINIVSLIIYSTVMIKGMKKQLGVFHYPEDKIRLVVDDVNDAACIKYIREYKPDAIFIYGTSIITQKFLSQVTVPIFNIHTGILPKYRNVHSDFWAFITKDYNNIGVTVIYLDAGIDTGDIVRSNTIKVGSSTSLLAIKINNLQVIPKVVIQVIRDIKENNINRKKQVEKLKGYFVSPTFADLIKLFYI